MQSASVLCAVVASLCLSVASSYPSIVDFRGFLHNVFEDVGGNWSNVRAIPDAEEKLGKGYGGWVTLKTGQLEDLDKFSRKGDCTVTLSGETALVKCTVAFDDLRYTYDFVTDDTKFSNAVGEMYGKVKGLSANLLVLATINGSSVVTARLRSFQLLSTTGVTTEQISKQNVTDLATFSHYIDNALVSFITKRALPAVQRDVATLLNATVADMCFNMIPEASSTATPRATSPLCTIKVTSTPSTVTGGSPTSSGGSGAASSNSAAAGGTTRPGAAASGAKSTTKSSPSSVITSASSPLASGRTSTSKGGPSTATGVNLPTITGSRTSSKDSHSGASSRSNGPGGRKGTAAATSTAGTTNTKWLTTNFNRYVDELLNSTGMNLAAQNMTPYSMLDGEEEMFKEERGTVLLKEGHVSGLDGFRYGDRFTVQVDGDLAAVTADFDFTNITAGFNFSADDEARSQSSGFVWGRVMNLSGELFILANWTDPSAVRYTFKGLLLHPGANYTAEVRSSQTLSSSLVKEVSHAAGSDVQKVLIPSMQEELARHVRAAVEKANSKRSGAAAVTAPTSALLVVLLASLALPCLTSC